MKRWLLILLGVAALSTSALGQEWTGSVRGSWVRAEERAQPGDVVLAAAADGCEIVVGADENSAVRQAAIFLAGDIQKISGYKPAIVANPTGRRAAIHLVTLSDAVSLPQGIAKQDLRGKWEAY